MLENSFPLLSAGFALGFMHALDADHVMAMTALNNRVNSLVDTVRLCAHWAIGHGSVLIVLGLLLFGLGIQLPATFVYLAELMVGVVLISIGCYCFYKFRSEKIRLVAHQHGDITHRHWQVENNHHAHGQGEKTSGHSSVLVGILHGLAGSAPALALIPVVAQGQLIHALAYLVIFSIGVLLSMLAFGVGVGYSQRKLTRFPNLFQYQRYLVALASVLLGGFWLHQSL